MAKEKFPSPQPGSEENSNATLPPAKENKGMAQSQSVPAPQPVPVPKSKEEGQQAGSDDSGQLELGFLEEIVMDSEDFRNPEWDSINTCEIVSAPSSPLASVPIPLPPTPAGGAEALLERVMNQVPEQPRVVTGRANIENILSLDLHAPANGAAAQPSVARRATPPPLPRLSQKPAVGNRFLKLVMALPEDYRAQYTLALANRLKESVADADPIADTRQEYSEENIQKIEAISWVARQWKRDGRFPMEYIMQVIHQIESYFDPALEDRKYAVLVENRDYDNFCNLIDGLKDIVAEKCIDRLDPVGRDQIREIRNAFALGNEGEGNAIMRQFFNSADSFFRMGNEGYQGLSQRNFMAEKDEHFPLVDYFREHELKSMTDQRARLRVLEVGPGIGNDAMGWIRMGGVAQYLGIDANPKAVETSNRRIRDLFAKGLKGKVANVIVGNYIDHFEAILRNNHKYFQKNDKRFKTIIAAISVIHYLVEERELRRVLAMYRDIIAPTRGRLVLATKTPRSDTCRLHTVVRREEGQVVGISRPEKIARKFMDRDYLMRVLREVGFDVEKATLMKQIVKEYDFPGFDEEFECLIIQALDPRKGG